MAQQCDRLSILMIRWVSLVRCPGVASQVSRLYGSLLPLHHRGGGEHIYSMYTVYWENYYRDCDARLGRLLQFTLQQGGRHLNKIQFNSRLLYFVHTQNGSYSINMFTSGYVFKVSNTVFTADLGWSRYIQGSLLKHSTL